VGWDLEEDGERRGDQPSPEQRRQHRRVVQPVAHLTWKGGQASSLLTSWVAGPGMAACASRAFKPELIGLTLNPQPRILDPEPWTLNPEPRILDPEP